MIELRTLTPDDWALWRELRLAALADAPEAFFSTLADWQGENDREEQWRRRLEAANSIELIAFLDGRPVGMIGGIPVSDGAIELISMWVNPLARGKGVGDELIESVVAWARGIGAKTARLCVAEGNEAAAALYRRNGFSHSGEARGVMPDGIRRELVMEKVL